MCGEPSLRKSAAFGTEADRTTAVGDTSTRKGGATIHRDANIAAWIAAVAVGHEHTARAYKHPGAADGYATRADADSCPAAKVVLHACV